jgi:hypothetical protein
MTRNCASRSGLSAPSRVLLLACRLNFCFFNSSPTTVWLRVADLVSELAQFLGQTAQTLASPAQRRHRIAARVGLDQGVQVVEQTGGRLGQRLASPAGPADPIGRRRSRRVQFLQPPPQSCSPLCRQVPPPALPQPRKVGVDVHPIQAISPPAALRACKANLHRSFHTIRRLARIGNPSSLPLNPIRFAYCLTSPSCVRPHNAAVHTPRACMEVRGSGPNRRGALEALRNTLVFPPRLIDRP